MVCLEVITELPFCRILPVPRSNVAHECAGSRLNRDGLSLAGGAHCLPGANPLQRNLVVGCLQSPANEDTIQHANRSVCASAFRVSLVVLAVAEIVPVPFLDFQLAEAPDEEPITITRQVHPKKAVHSKRLILSVQSWR